MRLINIFLDTISGNTQGLVRTSESYIEISRDVFDLEIPTNATDRAMLYNDRNLVADDLKKSLKKYKEEWQNNKQNTK